LPSIYCSYLRLKNQLLKKLRKERKRRRPKTTNRMREMTFVSCAVTAAI
jgi:hypothetical protein